MRARCKNLILFFVLLLTLEMQSPRECENNINFYIGCGGFFRFRVLGNNKFRCFGLFFIVNDQSKYLFGSLSEIYQRIIFKSIMYLLFCISGWCLALFFPNFVKANFICSLTAWLGRFFLISICLMLLRYLYNNCPGKRLFWVRKSCFYNDYFVSVTTFTFISEKRRDFACSRWAVKHTGSNDGFLYKVGRRFDPYRERILIY